MVLTLTLNTFACQVLPNGPRPMDVKCEHLKHVQFVHMTIEKRYGV